MVNGASLTFSISFICVFKYVWDQWFMSETLCCLEVQCPSQHNIAAFTTFDHNAASEDPFKIRLWQ